MKTRAILDLAGLSDTKFFSEVSVGLGHILESAASLEQDARLLAEHGRARGFCILFGMVDEEAAKFLLLLDAVRCPRDPREQLKQHLKQFYSHLAKRIYASACYWQVSTFGQLAKYVENECQEFYLDGPRDKGWIFRNQILEEREQEMYVDYVETDKGHLWLAPPNSNFDLLFDHTPVALSLAQALHVSGCTAPDALALIAQIWRPVQMAADFRWDDLHSLKYTTLKELAARGYLLKQPQEVYKTIMDWWTFPLYSRELKLVSVDRTKLRETQKHEAPDS
jgi:AbiV family abortive infection protein